MAEKTERLSCRLSPEIKSLAEKNASEQGRSLSNYIEWLIKNDKPQK